MTDLTDFGVTINSGAWYDPSLCHALVDGDQCSNGYETESSDEDAQLCWQHADADRLRRVDDYPNPALDLRDDLLEETELSPSIALGLSTLADDVQELWELLIEGGPLEFGGKEHSERAVPNWAADVAQHPDLDVDDHLWSHKNCIAITGKGDRCPNSGYGPTRMCGMHQDADDPDTILDEADDDDVTDDELLEAFAERGGHASDSHIGLDVAGSAEATGELRNAGRFGQVDLDTDLIFIVLARADEALAPDVLEERVGAVDVEPFVFDEVFPDGTAEFLRSCQMLVRIGQIETVDDRVRLTEVGELMAGHLEDALGAEEAAAVAEVADA